MSEEELAKTTATALRPSGLGQLETTIATELCIAIFNTRPLEKIRHIVEAFLLLPEENKEQIATKEERELYSRMHTLALSFLDLQMLDRFAALVPFSFSGELGEKYLGDFTTTFFFSDDVDSEWRESVLKGDPKARYQYFHELVRWLLNGAPLSICLSVKSCFVNQSMPKAIRLAHTIVVKFITRETWEQALAATLGGKKRGSSEADILAS